MLAPRRGAGTEIPRARTTGGGETTGFKKKILLGGGVATVAIVAILVVFLLLGGLNPPVDVYARPTPSPSESPFDLMPSQVAGFELDEVEEILAGEIGAEGSYGEITIAIYRFYSSSDADFYLDATIDNWMGRSGSTVYQHIGEVHWMTHTHSGWSMFVWHKGVWVFGVIAPDQGLRNQVVEELAF